MADGLQHVRTDEFPEAYLDDARAQKTNVTINEAYYDEPKPEHKTILGFRRRHFIILAVILSVAVIAAIGGSVGGSLAIQNKNSTTTPSVAASITSASPTSSVASSTISSPPTPSPSASNTLLAPKIGEASILDVSCPSSQSLSYQGKTFDCRENTDDLTGQGVEYVILAVMAYSLEQCANACIQHNKYNSNQCKGFTLNRLIGQFYNDQGANCWLKNNTDGYVRWTTLANTTAGVLLE